MKKNKMMRLASVLLIMVMLTTSIVGGTFAKYTTTASGTDTARVAKWEIKYNGTAVDTTGSSVISFDLFKTVSDDEANSITAETDDPNVANGTDTKIIAPGTGGKFLMKIENTSEVTATYKIELSDEQENIPAGKDKIPIEYSLDNGNWATSIASLNENVDLMKDVTLDIGSNKDVTVYWRWVFEDTTSNTATVTRDTNDTALGLAAATATAGSEPKVTVTATITVTQVD